MRHSCQWQFFIKNHKLYIKILFQLRLDADSIVPKLDTNVIKQKSLIRKDQSVHSKYLDIVHMIYIYVYMYAIQGIFINVL